MSVLPAEPGSPPTPADPVTALLVAFTRLEAKVDVALGDHAARLDSQARDVADHETRLRAIEARPTVTPTGLWTTVLGVLTAAGVLVTLWTNLAP